MLIRTGTVSNRKFITFSTEMQARNWVAVVFFYNEKTPNDTKKKSWKEQSMLAVKATFHEFFSCHFVLFVVQKKNTRR